VPNLKTDLLDELREQGTSIKTAAGSASQSSGSSIQRLRMRCVAGRTHPGPCPQGLPLSGPNIFQIRTTCAIHAIAATGATTYMASAVCTRAGRPSNWSDSDPWGQLIAGTLGHDLTRTGRPVPAAHRRDSRPELKLSQASEHAAFSRRTLSGPRMLVPPRPNKGFRPTATVCALNYYGPVLALIASCGRGLIDLELDAQQICRAFSMPSRRRRR
jgi:hypothetical protein